MKISVLLPTHNRAEMIGFTIRSILAQTFTDWELLVVGDGCTDATGEVVTSFADARIRWFDWPKAPGYGYRNRNQTLRQAQGELIAYACDDDLWMADHLAHLLDAMETTQADLGCTRPLFVEPDGRILPIDFDLRDPHVLASFLESRVSGISSSCIIHRRSCFEKVGYWDESLEKHGDWELWLRILRASEHPVAFVPIPTVLHFRAHWRKESNACSRLKELPFAPLLPALRLPPNPSEQEKAWHKLSSSTENWSVAVRDAVDEADLLVSAREHRLIEDYQSAPLRFFEMRDYPVHAEDNDPRFHFPPCDYTASRRLLLRVEITADKPTMLQLFFQTTSHPHFSEEQSLRCNLHTGLNIFYLSLAVDGLTKQLRMDPACHAGEYFIHALEVRGDALESQQTPELFTCQQPASPQ